ncbi:MAG: tRNA (N6-isopentenyl adenosine(37)-C2)-methylthiotransferase MiaB [Acidobacteria bacterium]|nr:MAG: tRNA (N6-isopentenyl adenosine(37)-C2)-methylthiotransferase MiaB [Acidobacteriota bacterium]
METYFIETWGCQMNVLDTQRLEGLLQQHGLRPAGRAEDADVALLNTCSVREKAVQKVLSRLGELHGARQAGGKPATVGLCGCVAEQEGARLLARSPVLSFVLGPGRVAQLPAALDAVAAGRRVSITGFEPARDYDAHLIARGNSARQYVTAIEGCNQHCTFCVVPYTRGHESSRPLREIVREVEAVAAGGGKEITLLGQTVNAYRCPATGADFGDLLQAVGKVAAAWRIQFVTSHPKFFTDRMIDKIAGTPRVGSYLHLPFQAGSNAVLKRMHRGYTREEYVRLVGQIRAAMPGVTLSTDVIVGFPGETEADFLETLEVVSAVRFGQLYGFIYSARPRTPALGYPGRVARSEAGERLERLFEAQSPVQLELNQALIGRSVEILVDGPARRGSEAWQGRGPDNRVVNVQGWPGVAHGQIADVTITGATAHSLLGELRPGGPGA